MKRLNQKGFTLIELLAVIIILGVLLLIAVPSMNNVIEKSKKDGFVSNAKSYIGAVRYGVIQGDYETPTKGAAILVHVANYPLDQGSTGTSPYGLKMNSAQTYVVVYNNGNDSKDDLIYYFAGMDTNYNCIQLTAENDLDATQNVYARDTTKCSTSTIKEVGQTASNVTVITYNKDGTVRNSSLSISKVYSENF